MSKKKIIAEYFTEQDKKNICQFADKITPKSWNIFSDHIRTKYMPEVLNIQLLFIDIPLEFEHDNLGGYVPIFADRAFFYKNVYPDARSAFRTYGNFLYAETFIKLFPNSLLDIEGTIIHQLAHVAVSRYGMWQQKSWKKDFSRSMRDEDDLHGPLFQRFYKVLLDRTKKVFGEEMVKTQWKHLEFYGKK